MSKLENSSQKATIKCIVPEEKSGIASKQLVQMKERGEHYVTWSQAALSTGLAPSYSATLLYSFPDSGLWGRFHLIAVSLWVVDATGDSASFAIVAQMIFSGTDLMEGHPFGHLHKTLEEEIFFSTLDIYFRLPN